MQEIFAFTLLLLGLLVRIGVPIAITLGLVYLFTRLDAHWRAEAARKPAAVPVTMVKNVGCWKINGCAPEDRARCKAFNNPDRPCWQVYRSQDGLLSENCLGCKVFKEAPAPVPA